MKSTRRTFLATLVVIACALPVWAGQAPGVASVPSLTDDEVAAFLLKARIGSKKSAGGGVTDSKRANTRRQSASSTEGGVGSPGHGPDRSTELRSRSSSRMHAVCASREASAGVASAHAQ